MKKSALILTGILIFFFVSVVLADMVEVDAKKRIIYISDNAWNLLTVPDKEHILENFATTYPGYYWEIRLLYSGKKIGEVYPKDKKWKLILP